MPAQTTTEQAVPSLTKQATWLLAAKVIGFAMSLIAPLIIVRMLSQTDFGLYKQVYLVLSTGLQLLTFGFHMNLFYFLPRRPGEKPKIVFNVLLVHAAVGFFQWPYCLSTRVCWTTSEAPHWCAMRHI